MAGRVNTKFVLALSGVLIALFVGVLATVWFIKTHNAPDLAKAGDVKMAAAVAKAAAGDSVGANTDYEAAEKLYSKAVNKESTNVEYLTKWRDCLRAWTPSTQTTYLEKYNTIFVAAHRQLALVKRSDIQAHRDYLDLLPSPTTPEFSRQAAEFTINEVKRTMDLLGSAAADKGPGQVLRRYRGLMIVRMMSEHVEVPPEQVELAQQDLQAAQAVEPNENDLVIGLYTWATVQAENARREGRAETAAGFDKQAADVLAAALASRPADPELMALRLALDLDEIQRKAAVTLVGNELIDYMRKAVVDLKPRLDAVEAAYRQADPKTLSLVRLGRLRDLEAYIDPAARSSRTIGLMRRALEARPDDADLLLSLATVLAGPGDPAESIALLQRITELPQKPLSSAGARLFGFRTQAVFNQANYSIQAWENSKDKDPKAAAASLARAREYRAKLGQLLGSSDATLALYVDAFLKFAESDWPAAKRMLVEFNSKSGGTDIRALWTLAKVELNLNNPGAAKQILDAIEKMRPDLSQVQLMLASLDIQLKNPDMARARLEGVLKLEKDNKAAQAMLDRLNIETGVAKSTDPVAAVIMDAQRLLDGKDDSPPDLAGAQKVLEDGLKANAPDPRLFVALVMLKAQVGDKAGALAAAKDGLAAFPNNKDLASAVDQLGQSDPVEWRLKQIDLAQASDLDKELERYRTYLAVGKADLAKAALDRAAKLGPEDPRVVEQLFITAIRARDFAAAGAQVQVAVAKDLDGNGGTYYKARLLAAQGNNAEAAAILKVPADAKTASVEILRLLARLYSILGRTDDADNTFKQALGMRPNDTALIVEYITSIAQRGDAVAALSLARESEHLGKSNPQFVDLLLSLESAVGNRDVALARREGLYKRDPADQANTPALARLYIDAKRWDDARKLIDGLRAAGDTLDTMLLEARFQAAKVGWDKALAVMNDYISRQGSAVTSEPFVACGQVLAELRRPEDALAMLERGRAYQNSKDPAVAKTDPVDRIIGDLLSSLGRTEAAAEVYARIIADGADGPRQEVRTRLVELYIALGRYKDASTHIEQIKAGSTPDLALTLLRADIASGLGDEKKARQIYDSAIASFSNDPMVYFRRATWTLSKGISGAQDAMADLEAALRVRPTFWQAHSLRASVYARLGKPDEATLELREALKINSHLDDLRISLMNDLCGRGKSGDAFEIGEEAVRSRPNDLDLFLACAAVFSQRQDWARAERFLSNAWALDNKRSDVAQAYLDSLLNNEPPNLNMAQSVIKQLAAQVDTDAGLLVARAKFVAKRKGIGDAVPDLLASMTILPLEPDVAVLAWFADVRRLVAKPNDAFALFDRPDVPERFKEWATFFKASVLNELPEKRPQAAALLDTFLATGGTSDPYRLGYRLRGTIPYFGERYAEAATVWKTGAEKFPDDWELLNNIAYTMARYLGQAEQALPYAERSVKAAPRSAEALDTLGYIQMTLNKLDEAEKTLKVAYAASRQPTSRLQIELHFARLMLLMGKKEKAIEQLTDVENILKDNPTLAPPYKAELEELKAKAGSH